jgi:phosphate acetyltransferase
MDRFIENKTFEEIRVGDSAKVQHTLTFKDIQLFAIMSGDVNPAHLDVEYAKNDLFHKIIAHGMWGGSLISTVLGTLLPGPGTIYLSQSLKFVRPVGIGDTITAQVIVMAKDSQKKRIKFDCVCLNQLGKEVITGLAEVIAPTEKIKRPRVKLPKIEFKEKNPSNPHSIIPIAAGLEPLVTAVVHPVDYYSLKGALEAHQAGIIRAILVGPEAKILKLAKEEDLEISNIPLIPTPHSHAAAERAVQLVRSGEVHALMKGKLHTDEFMQPILDKEKGLRTGRRMSHVFMADIPSYPRPLFITDAALNIAPGLMEKKDIVQNAIDLFQAIGFGIPRVAILSAVEMVNEKIPSTLDATALCKMADRQQIVGGILDGPLAFDNAISEEAAQVKGIQSQVAGKADILVVPDLETGNMLLKQLTLLAGAKTAGIVMGAKVPLILTSRSDDEWVRIASCALANLVRKAEGDFYPLEKKE